MSVSSAETVVPLLQLVFPQGEESHVGAPILLCIIVSKLSND